MTGGGKKKGSKKITRDRKKTSKRKSRKWFG
jgi:hypothetical protein